MSVNSSVLNDAESILRAAIAARGLRYVGIRGNPKGPVCVVGEAPGKEEEAISLPFVGASGKLLDSLLRTAGFVGGDVWFTNPYKCRPPDNDISRITELGIPLHLFISQFTEEMGRLKPTIIVTCGKTSTQLLCPETKPFRKSKKEDEEGGFGNWRGSLLTSPLFNWPHYVIPMYHTAYVLRNYEEKEICQFILERAFEEFSYWRTNKVLQSLPMRHFLVNPQFADAESFLLRCLKSQDPISVDIELLRRIVPYTISFALDPTEAISLSFWKYSSEHRIRLWRLMDELLSTKAQIGQNYISFDCVWLRALGFNPNINLVHDTLIRHSILWPGLPHKLQFQCMQYTRQPYYKDEGKSWNPKEVEKLMRYNCLDTAVTYEVFNAQEKEFTERDIQNP